MKTTIFFLLALVFLTVAPATWAATLTVGHGGGSEFTTLSEAIDSAISGDTISATAGVYDTTSGETFPLVFEKDLMIIGSSSAEVIVNATGSGSGAFALNPPASFEIAGMTITGGSSESGGGGVLVTNGSGIIRDCTIKGNTTTLRGGGLFLHGIAIVTVENCLFEDNHAPGIVRLRPSGGNVSNGQGGAISLALFSGGFVSLRNCMFFGNSASRDASAVRIGGVGGNTVFEDCIFEKNRYGVPELAGLEFATTRVDSNNNATFRRCQFRNNEKTILPLGANPFSSRSYALHQETVFTSGSLTVEDCEFSHNRGMGGVHVGRGQIRKTIIEGNDGNGLEATDCQVNRCLIQENVLTGVILHSFNSITTMTGSDVISNGHGDSEDGPRRHVGGINLRNGQFEVSDCTVTGNVGYFEAGGVSAFVDHLVMTNCLIAGNRSSGEFNPVGGMVVPGGSREGVVDLINVTIAGNISNASPNYDRHGPDGIRIDDPADVNIVNSVIWNGTRAIEWDSRASVNLTYCDLSQPLEGNGNIFDNPQFLHPWDGSFADYRLPCNSPCIDAGTTEGAPSLDIEGTTRPRGAGVDMGAYENCHFDVNGDRSEDVLDFLSFSPEWYQPTDETNFGFDLNRSGVSRDRVDRLDLDELLEGLGGR